MPDTLAGLAADIEALARGKPRFLLAIAGPPTSGKTWLSQRLAESLPDACALPMDGFHLDDAILRKHGTQARKGAPFTFDINGFAALLKRARSEPDFFAPSFDRDLEISRAGAIEVTAKTRILIVEGNYLLLDAPLWRDLRGLFDQTWYLDVPMAIIEKRLRERWKDHGREQGDAERWIKNNDLPNVKLVQTSKTRADRKITFA